MAVTFDESVNEDPATAWAEARDATSLVEVPRRPPEQDRLLALLGRR